MRATIEILAALTLVGCAASPPPAEPPPLTPPPIEFKASEIAWSIAEGANIVQGQAFIRQQDGKVVTCAGANVNLIPDSSYARSRMQYLYSSVVHGFNDAEKGARLTASDPVYEAALRRTVCDAQGNFTFDGVPDGKWYVVATVVWMDPARKGGSVMQQVTVKHGETQSVIVAG